MRCNNRLGLGKLSAVTGMAVFMWMAAASHAKAENLKVISTFSIVSDFARIVGGEHISLTTLVGPDGDAHAYEPRPADAVALRNADLVLANGLHFEGFLPRLWRASGATAPIVELARGARLLRNTPADRDEDTAHSADAHGHDHAHAHMHHHDGHDHAHDHDHDHDGPAEGGDTSDHHHHHGEYDPHAWQAVGNAKIYVDNIAKAFCKADGQACPRYRANARAYKERLDALDRSIREAVARIPPDRRTVITSHDAFGYLGREYGLRFLAPQGISTESEASAAGVAALIRQIKSNKASALFLENVSNPRLVERIAAETGMRIGGKLYSDALSTESGPAATYLDMMQHNVATIRDAIITP